MVSLLHAKRKACPNKEPDISLVGNAHVDQQAAEKHLRIDPLPARTDPSSWTLLATESRHDRARLVRRWDSCETPVDGTVGFWTSKRMELFVSPTGRRDGAAVGFAAPTCDRFRPASSSSVGGCPEGTVNPTARNLLNRGKTVCSRGENEAT